MKRLLFLALAATLLFASCKKDTDYPVDEQDIVILYDNDPHCELAGYPKMATLRQQMSATTEYVTTVSVGDFLSGNVYGSVSKGGYVVRLMNATGYDYVTLGNHEFDYTVQTMMDTLERLTAKVLCCNFRRTTDNSAVYAGYDIKNYGGRKVAFVGVTTPSSITTSTPAYFRDSEGNICYTFCPHNLPDIVQAQVNQARNEGAVYVVLLSHVGSNDNAVQQLIASTYGINVVLDGHSHAIIPQSHIANRKGEQVLLTSSGTKFQNIGRVVIKSDGTITSELVSTSELSDNATVKDLLDRITENYSTMAARHIGVSQVALRATDDNGNTIVRTQECTIGNFCADAMRAVFEADIAVVNGGGIRNSINVGEITFNDIYSVFPYNNSCSLIQVRGQEILDALELSCRDIKSYFGGFLQVSGIRFKADTTITSSVVLDENGTFVRVDGSRRIHDVEVWDKASQSYQPLNPNATYTLASNDYIALNQGNGYVFPSAEVLRPSMCSDLEVLERYISEHLSGIIGTQYSAPEGRIIFE